MIVPHNLNIYMETMKEDENDSKESTEDECVGRIETMYIGSTEFIVKVFFLLACIKKYTYPIYSINMPIYP